MKPNEAMRALPIEDEVAVKLAEGGNKVHLMYWNRTPLIAKLGSGTVDAEAELLGNGEALRM